MRINRSEKSIHRSMPFAASRIRPLAAIIATGLFSVPPATWSSETGLEEIIVTAQKQAEALQNVPISIQAFDAKALEKGGVVSLVDVKSLAPSVEIKNFPVSSEDLLITMRGMPVTSINIFNDSPTAIHIDGVYIARNSGLNLTVADLASVEILKGPQGTLYGRNAISGVINLNTTRPNLQDFGFSQAITLGNYNRRISKTSINVPLSESLAAKLAVVDDRGDGYVGDANGSGRHWGDREANAGRLDFRWRPANRVTVDYGYDWNRTRSIPVVNQCLTQASSNPGPTTSPTFGSGSPLARYAYTYPNQCSRERMDAIPMPNGPNLFMADNNYVTNTGHMLKVEWEASDTLTVRSISAYRDLDSTTHQVLNSGNTDVISGFAINYPSLPQYPVTRAYSPLVPSITTAGLSYGAQNHITRDKYLSQEFALLGRPSEFFKYTAGLYYFDEKGTNRATQGEQMVLNSFGSPFSAIPGQGPISLISLGNGTNASAHNSSWAVFGQFSWRPDILERRFEITPGVRYTRDRREATLQNNGATTYFYAPSGLTAGTAGALFRGATQAVPAGYIVVPGTAIVPASAGESTFSRTTPSLTLSYQLDEHQMAYGKIVKGYRSGGFHAASSSAAFFTQGYGPETLTSTELGFKGEFFGRRLRSNFAVFQSKYSDQQITISKRYISTSTSDVVNAGKSTYRGFELDLTAALTDALRLNFNYAQVKFDYNRIIDQGADVTNFYHFLPAEVSYSLGANYSFGKVGPGKLDWNLGYAYTDKSHTNVADIYTVTGGVATLVQPVGTENSTTPAFGLWNTRLAMSGIPVGPGNQGDITVGLWIKNVANRKSPGFVVDPGVGTMVGAVSPFLPPRTYGVDLIYRY